MARAIWGKSYLPKRRPSLVPLRRGCKVKSRPALEPGGRSLSGSSTRSACSELQESRMPSTVHSPQSDQKAPLLRNHRRARLAAVGALIVAVFLVAVALSMAGYNPVGLVVTFASVFVIAFCAWFFFVRRGPIRLLVLLPALLGLIGLITYGYQQKYALMVLVVLLALFGLCARYAVRNHPASEHTAHRHARPAGRHAEAC